MSGSKFHCRKHTIPAQHIRGYYRATANSEEEELQISVKQHASQQSESAAWRRHDNCLPCSRCLQRDVRAAVRRDSSNISKGRKRIQAKRNLDCGRRNTWRERNYERRSSWERLLLGRSCSRSPQHDFHLSERDATAARRPWPQYGRCQHRPTLFDASPSVHDRRMRRAAIVQGARSFQLYHIVKRRDVWASKQDAVRQTLSGGLQRSWDHRVIKCWEQHAFRELPTLLYSQAPVEVAQEAEKQSSRPVTLSTTKHHAMRAYCRGAHPSPGLPLDSFIPHRLGHPDISKSEHDLQKSPVYRPEVTSVFRHLPFLRPSCFFIYGGNSHFFSASAPSRKDKLQTTGTAGGGSGGVHAEAVKDVLLEGVGHFAPFENPHLVAEATSQWLSARVASWNKDQSEEAQTWASIGVREKAMVEDDTQWWAKEWFSANPRKGSSKGVRSLTTPPSSRL